MLSARVTPRYLCGHVGVLLVPPFAASGMPNQVPLTHLKPYTGSLSTILLEFEKGFVLREFIGESFERLQSTHLINLVEISSLLDFAYACMPI